MTFRVADCTVAIRKLIDRNVFLINEDAGRWFYKHGTCGYVFRTVDHPLDISTWHCPRCADSEGMP